MLKLMIFFLTALFSFHLVSAENCTEANDAYADAKNKVNQKTSHPPGPQSVPPPYHRYCLGETEYSGRDQQQDNALNQWSNSYLAEESELAKKVVSSGREFISCGGSQNDVVETIEKIGSYVKESTLRLARLVSQNPKSFDHYVPTIKILIKKARDAELLGTDADVMLNTASEMTTELLNETLRELAIDHDYRYTPNSIIELTRVAQSLGSDADLSNILERIRKAMHFEVEIKNETYFEDFQWNSTKRGKINFLDIGETYTWQPYPAIFDVQFEAEVEDGEMTSSPHQFDQYFNYDIRACEQEQKIFYVFDTLGPLSEVFKLCDDEGVCMSIPLPMGGLNTITHSNLLPQLEHVMIDGKKMMRLKIPLQNQNPETGSKIFHGSSADGTESELTFKMLHTPI